MTATFSKKNKSKKTSSIPVPESAQKQMRTEVVDFTTSSWLFSLHKIDDFAHYNTTELTLGTGAVADFMAEPLPSPESIVAVQQQQSPLQEEEMSSFANGCSSSLPPSSTFPSPAPLNFPTDDAFSFKESTIHCIYLQPSRNDTNFYPFTSTTASLSELCTKPYKYYIYLYLQPPLDPKQLKFRLKSARKQQGETGSIVICKICPDHAITGTNVKMQVQLMQHSRQHSNSPLSIEVLYNGNVVFTSAPTTVRAKRTTTQKALKIGKKYKKRNIGPANK